MGIFFRQENPKLTVVRQVQEPTKMLPTVLAEVFVNIITTKKAAYLA